MYPIKNGFTTGQVVTCMKLTSSELTFWWLLLMKWSFKLLFQSLSHYDNVLLPQKFNLFKDFRSLLRRCRPCLFSRE